ncbi:hypothetical protein PT2222_330016 [Paraburkholderia tropica]
MTPGRARGTLAAMRGDAMRPINLKNVIRRRLVLRINRSEFRPKIPRLPNRCCALLWSV